MGMTIDNSCESAPMSREEVVDTLKTMVFGVQAFERFNAKERETLDKAWNIIDQYESRLKADMVAMLEDLDLQIDEMDIPQMSLDSMSGYYWVQGLFKDLVQEKINALRGNEDG